MALEVTAAEVSAAPNIQVTASEVTEARAIARSRARARVRLRPRPRSHGSRRHGRGVG